MLCKKINLEDLVLLRNETGTLTTFSRVATRKTNWK